MWRPFTNPLIIEQSIGEDFVVPELPEVETVVRDLRPRLIGRVISSLRLSKQSLRARLAPAVESRHPRPAHAGGQAARQMDLHPAGQRTHPRHPPGHDRAIDNFDRERPVPTHTHVVLGLGGSAYELRFRDIRRFGSVSLLARHGTDRRVSLTSWVWAPSRSLPQRLTGASNWARRDGP